MSLDRRQHNDLQRIQALHVMHIVAHAFGDSSNAGPSECRPTFHFHFGDSDVNTEL
jgi:hypothetical protein